MRFWAIGEPIIPRPRKPMRAGISSKMQIIKKILKKKIKKKTGERR